METTDWFPGNVTPRRVGVYRVKHPLLGGIGWAAWDGKLWSNMNRNDVAGPMSSYVFGCGFQNKQWLGLTKEAK